MPADNLFAFVLMPFGDEFQDTYRLGIKAAAVELGIRAERVDEQFFYKEGILTRIYEQIKLADIIIADMTGKNPNVFYEVGYAHALGKNCILITNRADDIPFDLKHHRHIVYNSSITKLKYSLSRDLFALKEEIDSHKGPFRIEFGSVLGWIDKSDAEGYTKKPSRRYYCHGDVSFKINIYNDGTKASPEIDDLYIYTGTGWRFKQEKVDCVNMDSDITTYSMRHVLRCPHKRVTKGSWIEVGFSGRKLLDSSNEPISKDSYNLKGNMIIRVNTSDDTCDIQLPLLVECNDIPF